MATRHLGQKNGPRIDRRGDVLGCRPQRRADVHVRLSLVVGVKIEHEVGVVGERQQPVAQMCQCPIRLHRRKPRGHRGPDRCHVRRRVWPQRQASEV